LTESASPVLLPGSTIGIFGGGQLGRLTAMAARTMGYRIHVLDPDPGCPARFVVDQCVEADWSDAHEAARLARGCDVITLEIEQVSLASMNAAGAYAPVRPSESLLGVIQDRIEQKDWLRRNGFPIGDYRAVRSYEELRDAVKALGGRCFCKSATGGYDGRGQGKVGFNPANASTDEELRAAWKALGEGPGVVEKAIDLDREISILVARSPRGEVKVYPAAWNHHENQILAWSVLPAPLSDCMAREARELADAIANCFVLEGILAVEMFVTTDGKILVNELAPRPHNSYHSSERACVTSQFEQLVRAVCNLPLGEPSVVQPCAISNLLGDLWLGPEGPRTPHFDAALAVPGVRLHLYEKLRPRKGRKMGHLSAVADTAEEAVTLVERAHSLL
jgi:5-(carboxyamino)imidazole ribonucleotide synthase